MSALSSSESIHHPSRRPKQSDRLTRSASRAIPPSSASASTVPMSTYPVPEALRKKRTICTDMSKLFGRIAKEISAGLPKCKELCRKRKATLPSLKIVERDSLDEAFQVDDASPQLHDGNSTLVGDLPTRTKVDPSPPTLVTLIPELLLAINKRLPPSSSACLSLTCQRLYKVLNLVNMNSAPFRLEYDEMYYPHVFPQDREKRHPERWILLQALARDESHKWRNCRYCLRLHRLPEKCLARDVNKFLRIGREAKKREDSVRGTRRRLHGHGIPKPRDFYCKEQILHEYINSEFTPEMFQRWFECEDSLTDDSTEPMIFLWKRRDSTELLAPAGNMTTLSIPAIATIDTSLGRRRNKAGLALRRFPDSYGNPKSHERSESEGQIRKA